MTVRRNILGFGDLDPASIDQLQRCIDNGGREAFGVLCADHHKGYSMPIGGVLASQSVVMPAGVGYDIACGNCAVQTPVLAKDIDTANVMDEIFRVISFGMGRNNTEKIDEHPVFDTIDQSPVPQQRKMLQAARHQLGTVGSGNHYVDLFEDRADGSLWVGVHFGSRGLGHKTATGFLALAAGQPWDSKVNDSMDAPPTTIALGTPLADDYLAAMEVAGAYAYAGRNWVVDRVLRILGIPVIKQRIHNHHNFAWRETHHGNSWLVIRKGATPAFPGQRGFIGGSMLGDAVIVEGVDGPLAQQALYSTVHGAGRVMSRTAAAGKSKTSKQWRCGQRECPKFAHGYPAREFQRGPNGELPKCPACTTGKLRLNVTTTKVAEGLVDWPAWQARMIAEHIELRGAGPDEAPQCYKHLPDVLRAHGDTIKTLHTLRPIGVAMAGKDIVDPFRD